MVAIIVILIIAFLAYDFYQRFYKPGLSMKQWPELASRTGLSYEPPVGAWSNRRQAQVAGKYRGYELKLDVTKVIPGAVDDGIATYNTRVVLSPPYRVSGTLALQSKWLFSREGLKIGDEQFDRRFVIESQPKDFVARVFASPELRRRFLQAKPRQFKLSALGLRLETKGIESDVNSLHGLLDLACDVADTVKAF
jgi:hypothetical protein